MKFLRKFSKPLAALLAINLLSSLVLPNFALALTAGPTAPEYSSFEPVDMTDMVNLTTGDFVYNIPLLEVPGPAGGYPISLSYHAGIQPDQEASWVGLGWSLNVGAINRLVNGFPDDHKDVENVVRDFWEGGEQVSTSVGLTFGLPLGDFLNASVSAGLVFANDTYQGKGVGGYLGGYLGAGKQLGKGSAKGSLGVSGTLNFSPFGGSSASAGLHLGVSSSSSEADGFSLTESANLSLTTNGGLAGSAGLSWQKAQQDQGAKRQSTTGGSIFNASVGGAGFNVSAVGVSGGVNNSKAGKVSSYSNSSNLSIPTPLPGLSISLGRNYVRYWIDESETVKTNGALYSAGVNHIGFDEAHYADRSYDTYDIFNPLKRETETDYNHMNELNGTFSESDHYEVLGQGIHGTMKPNAPDYLEYLHRRSVQSNNSYATRHYALGNTTSEKQFRFVGDFSNRLEYDTPPIEVLNPATDGVPFIKADLIGSNVLTGLTGNDGFDNERLLTGTPIKWKTNEAFLSNEGPKILDPIVTGFDRATKGGDQIGGFIITNKSGVSYHYALPAYSYDEHMYSGKIDESQGETFNYLKKEEPYAYTWLLTAVTGSDYVDRNNDNLPNEGDWGYWVSFDYGLWSDEYAWRNPGQGFNRDLDNEYKSFSCGKKEVYYLDAVKTATHTALFVKSLRKDGKGSIHRPDVEVSWDKTDVEVDEGSFLPTERPLPIGVIGSNRVDYPVASLKLDQVMLLENEAIENIDKASSYEANISYTYGYSRITWYPGAPPPASGGFTITLDVHDWDNTIDEHDTFIEDLRSKALKTISLGTDYSLMEGTPNSFDNDFYNERIPSSDLNDYTYGGKLTLKGIEFGGHGGASIIPTTRFSYDNSPNPTYNRFKTDNWGFYKSDHPGIWDNSNLTKATTKTSAENVDAWSLTGIKNSLGAQVNVEYESDDYHESVLVKNHSFIIKQLSVDIDEVMIEIENYGLDLNELLTTDEEVEVLLVRRNNCRPEVRPRPALFTTHHFSVKPTSIFFDQILFEGQSFVDEVQTLETDYCTFTFLGGNASFDNGFAICGGGLRVKNISIADPIADVTTNTAYVYTIPGTEKSSGITSYEPIIVDRVPEDLPEGAQAQLKRALYQDFHDLMRRSRHVPGPGVMYEYVTIKESVEKEGEEQWMDGYATYQHQVFNANMIDIDIAHESEFTERNRLFRMRNVQLHDMVAQVGALKSVTLYNNQGQKLSETIHHHLFDDILEQEEMDEAAQQLLTKYNKQGLLTETYANARFLKNQKYKDVNNESNTDLVTYENNYLALISQYIKYPSIATGQTNINYMKGGQSETRNLAFDFYTGEVTETYSEDVYGNKYWAKTTPAYRLKTELGDPAYEFMGLKSQNPAYKNMLTQEGASFSYKLRDDFDPNSGADPADYKESLLGASVQLWESGRENVLSPDGLIAQSSVENGQHIYRKHGAVNFIGDGPMNPDGTYPLESIKDGVGLRADGLVLQDMTGWRKNGEATLYDVNSHILEAKDLNGHYAATKFDRKLERVYASVTNARYEEIAFSGAEDTPMSGFFGGDVGLGEQATRVSKETRSPHTGQYSLHLPNVGAGFTFSSDKVRPGRTYRISAWVNDPVHFEIRHAINGVAQPLTEQVVNQAEDWYQVSTLITLPEAVNTLTVQTFSTGADGLYLDDFMIAPVDAGITAYVYNEWGQLSDLINGNNLSTHYEYDDAGRLTSIWTESFQYGKKKISDQTITYTSQE